MKNRVEVRWSRYYRVTHACEEVETRQHLGYSQGSWRRRPQRTRACLRNRSVLGLRKELLQAGRNVQIEWSFPVRYGRYSFEEPTPETRCLMRLIDGYRPHLIYSAAGLVVAKGISNCLWILVGSCECVTRPLPPLRPLISDEGIL